MSEVVWRPSPQLVEEANLTRLMRQLGCDDYRALHGLSISAPHRFWPAVVDDLGLVFSRPWSQVVETSRGAEWATWFVGAELNVFDTCIARWAAERPDDESLVWCGEDGVRAALSWSDLADEVRALAAGLAELGIGPGDAVGLFLPMSLQVAVASFAVAYLGAAQVPIFSGFAAPAIAARLADAGAKAVITADASLRRGRVVPMKETVDEALTEVPGVEHVVVWPRLGTRPAMSPGRDRWWDDVARRDMTRDLVPRQVPSEHPYLIAYTSGTTGRPKGVLHVQGGFLVAVAREVAYQTDVKPADRILFSTDMGWIMGPWTVTGGLACGATVVLAEGAPDWPIDRLWQLVESERATMLGLSPTLVRALLPHGAPSADLSSLRTFCTTGEPWNLDPYLWLHEQVGGGRVPIVNISGGTEVGACFLSSCVVEPIKAVSVGYPALGMDVDVVDESGHPVRGEVGELVCRPPWPGMTRGLWRDPERYLETYFRRFAGYWAHGDWASIDDDGYWFLHGRSDDTLNIAGKRIGPAELESAAVAHPAVVEAAAIGIPHEVKGEVAWLFCVLRSDIDPSDELRAAIEERVVDAFGKAFRPERVVFVPALPKTRTAKIVRRVVRAQVLGVDPGDLTGLENPEALDEIAAAAR